LLFAWVLLDFEVWFQFWFLPAGLFFVPVHVVKRKSGLKPATTAGFFLIASGCPVKIFRS